MSDNLVSMPALIIVPGMPISGRTRKGVCQVGAIAFDTAGACFGLTARHVLECEPSPAVFDPGTGREIGMRVTDDPPPADNESFHRCIGRFRIESTTQVRMATPFRSIRGVANPVERVGDPVYWLDDDYGSAPGEVLGVGGAIHFKDPYTGTTTLLRDVIEVRMPDRTLKVRGEAGALLLDEQDLAIGLLISRLGKVCYLAPLSSYLEERNLALADDRTSKFPGVDVGLAEFAADLLQIEMGASRMRAEIAAETLLDGSAEEPVPENLRHLLESAE